MAAPFAKPADKPVRFPSRGSVGVGTMFLLLALAGKAVQASPVVPAHEGVTTSEQKFHMALEAQSAREYRTMLLLLRQSAGAGHLEAQEMLGIVLLSGPALYGNAVKLDRCEARAWVLRAAAQGSEIAQYQLTFLNRLRQAPSGSDVCQKRGE